MIRRITGTQVAEVARLEIGMAGTERAQADGSEQFGTDLFDDGGPVRFVEHGVTQGNGEELVRAARRVVAMLTVHDIEKMAALGGPETTVEGFTRAVGVL